MAKIFIIIGVIISMVLCSTLYMIGFHNIDLSFNMAILGKYGDYDIYNTKGDKITYSNLYIVGMNQTRFTFYMSMVSALIGGLAIGLSDEK